MLRFHKKILQTSIFCKLCTYIIVSSFCFVFSQSINQCNKFPRQVSSWREEESQGTVANTLAASQRKISWSTEDPDGDTQGWWTIWHWIQEHREYKYHWCWSVEAQVWCKRPWRKGSHFPSGAAEGRRKKHNQNQNKVTGWKQRRHENTVTPQKDQQRQRRWREDNNHTGEARHRWTVSKAALWPSNNKWKSYSS